MERYSNLGFFPLFRVQLGPRLSPMKCGRALLPSVSAITYLIFVVLLFFLCVCWLVSNFPFKIDD